MVFTLDAMHTQAETIEVIKDSGGEAPVNLSVFRNFAISIYRNNGYSNIKERIETEGGNFDFLTKVLK